MQHSISIHGFLILFLAAGPLMAQSKEEEVFQWSLGSDIGYYDNIELLPTGGANDTVASAQAALVVAHQGPRYEVNLAAAGQYQHYFQGTFSNGGPWGVVGDLNLHVVPEVLDWSLVDHYGPYWSDPLVVDTPENRAYVNYFETGPTVTLGAGNRTRVVVQGSYARSSYVGDAGPDAPDDLEYWLGDVALLRELGQATSLSLHGAVDRTSPVTDSATDASYDIYDGYLRFEATGSRTRIRADGGVTHLNFAGESQSRPLIRLELNRKLSDMATLLMSAGTGYSDSAELFVRAQDSETGPDPGGTVVPPNVDQTQTVTALNAPLEEDYANVSLTLAGRLTTVEVSGGYYNENFKSDSNLSKQEGWNYALLLSRDISEELSCAIRGGQATIDYSEANQREKLTTADLGLVWRLGRALSLVGQIEWGKQDYNVTAANYSYSSISVGLRYSPNSPRGANRVAPLGWR